MSLSVENQALFAQSKAPKSTADWDYALASDVLNALLDAAREEGRASVTSVHLQQLGRPIRPASADIIKRLADHIEGVTGLVPGDSAEIVAEARDYLERR